MEENNSFYPYQFGFRHNHSTNSALIEITEQIQEPCDTGLFACRVYLDLKKSFDTVNHNILSTKLEHHDIKVNVNYWLRSILMDRKPYASVAGKDSNLQEITHEVPQVPLLFIILYFRDTLTHGKTLPQMLKTSFKLLLSKVIIRNHCFQWISFEI